MYIHWIMVLSAVAGIVGFWAYMLEVIQGRIQRYTTWAELNRYQTEVAAVVIASPIVFIGALNVGAILKSYS